MSSKSEIMSPGIQTYYILRNIDENVFHWSCLNDPDTVDTFFRHDQDMKVICSNFIVESKVKS